MPSFAIRFLSVASLSIAAFGAAFLPAACGSDENNPTDTASGAGASGPGDCTAQGGVLVGDVCEPKCDPVKCLEGVDAGATASTNICVDNLCALMCTSHADCFNLKNGAGFPTQGQGYLMHTQDCAPGVNEADGVTVPVCQSNSKSRGFGYACTQGFECTDSYRNFTCPNGQPCDSPDGTAPMCAVVPDANGANVNTCQVDADACRGVADCKVGRCAIDFAPCTLEPACPPEQCQPLTCITAGPGDAEAYCTRTDCVEDTDCPGGFYCGAQRVNMNICGNDQKGPQAFPICGDNSAEGCMDPANFQLNGANYFEGPVCLMRTACLKREPCTSCTSDIDCNNPDMRCATTPGDQATVCATLCNPTVPGDCPLDEECNEGALLNPVPGWGACVPRIGKCQGDGNFCDPCIDDRDCGPTGVCLAASGTERSCLQNYPPTDACTTDLDCPTSITGVHGTCLNEDWGVAPGSAFYEKCYLPIDDPQQTGKTSCYLP